MDTITYAGVMLGLVLGAAYYLMVHRPKAMQAARDAERLSAITGGEVVLTKGGIFGAVQSSEGGVLELQVAPKSTIRIDRASIQSIIHPEDDRWAAIMAATAENDEDLSLAAAQ